MTRKSSERHGECDADSDTERSLLTRLVEDVIAFVICCYLVRLGVFYILSVKIPLIIMAVIAGVIVIGYRSYKWRKDHDNY